MVGRFHEARTRTGRIAAATTLWLVAVGSKFVVLELVDLVFGDSVSLGGFFSVTLLIVTLLVSRLVVRCSPTPRTPRSDDARRGIGGFSAGVASGACASAHQEPSHYGAAGRAMQGQGRPSRWTGRAAPDLRGMGFSPVRRRRGSDRRPGTTLDPGCARLVIEIGEVPVGVLDNGRHRS